MSRKTSIIGIIITIILMVILIKGFIESIDEDTRILDYKMEPIYQDEP